MVESNNNLLNLLKLAVTKLNSCNPTQLSPDKDSGIADSGSTRFYFTVADKKGGADFKKDWYLQGNCAP
jgi:hypothetical protein